MFYVIINELIYIISKISLHIDLMCIIAMHNKLLSIII